MRSALTVPVVCLVICVLFSGCGAGGESDRQTADRIREQARQRALEQRRAEALAAKRAREARKQEAAESKVTTGADQASFARVDAALPGRQGIVMASAAGRSLSQLSVLGSLQSGTAWSTAKVPVAMAAIAAGSATQGQLSAAITASDNAAAEGLWSGLGSGQRAADAANTQLRQSGDSQTSIQPRQLLSGYTAFGQTDWSLSEQVRFVSGMQCSPQGRQVLELMGRVLSSQRWGLANAGSNPRFKGGWGPGITPGQEGPWMERQMGIVHAADGSPYAVAIASEGGDHQAGITALNRLAAYVRGALPRTGSKPEC